MKNIIKSALFMGAAIFIGFTGSQANATSWYEYPDHYVAHQSYVEFIDQMSAYEKRELERYIEYQRREPCENYRQPPEGFMVKGCNLYFVGAGKKLKEPVLVKEVKQEFGDVIKTYQIHFAYDSYALNNKADSTITKIAREIKKYDPKDVTVAGFTDTAGPVDYNKKLAKKRAETVADALNKHGIKTYILKQKAYGESNLAVKTDDGVPLRENRRVVVDFRE